MTPLTHSHLKGLFTQQSSDYAKFRPKYPDSLFEYLSSLTQEHLLAWDCATGSGQAAVRLGEYYEHVIATDLTENQIASAVPHPHVDYQVGPAEASGLAEGSVDLITVAQAFHWFNAEGFFSEVRRVAKPGAIIALWCYGLARMTPEVNVVIEDFYANLLDGYWEKERILVEQGYRTIEFPFEEIRPPAFEMKLKWSQAHVLGYLSTWSAFQTYLKANPGTPNPLETTFKDALAKAWPAKKKELDVSWKLDFRIGRVR